MWFKNLRIWQLDAPWDISAEALSAALSANAFRPCAPGQLETIGWEAPVEAIEDQLVREVSGRQLLRARVQERVLPGAAVNEVLAERMQEIEAREGTSVRGARRRELADEVRASLVPRALLKSARQWLVVDRDAGLVMVDSAIANRGEALLSLLRGSLGSLALRPLAFAHPIDGVLTGWLRHRTLPTGLALGEWCDLEHPQDTRNKVRFRGQPLDEDEVMATLDRGLRVTALEVLWDTDAGEPLRCVLCEDGAIRRLHLPDDDPDALGDESPEARIDADLALLGLTLTRFFETLFPAFGGRAVD
ncbi:MAG: recombination-associated protein RdgC [Pseudomonadota bacterium]|nr:recombination-associated protein RdgC [Pseudomonadota bacterium]